MLCYSLEIGLCRGVILYFTFFEVTPRPHNADLCIAQLFMMFSAL